MRIRRPRIPVALAVAAAALTLAACTGGGASGASPAPTAPTSGSGSSAARPPTDAPALEQNYVRVVRQVLPSVVQITTDRDLGSGIVFDDKGDIVTNAHVVGNATQFQVRLAGKPTTLSATLVGTYPPDDLAVIHLNSPPSSLHAAHFGDSTTLQVGDIVLAMGNPLGLTGSVSDGIVSATGRLVAEPTGAAPPARRCPTRSRPAPRSTRATAAARWWTWPVTW